MIVRAAILFLLATTATARDVGGVLDQDTVWSGTVEIVEDVIVAAGVTLTIEAGTLVIPATDVKGEGRGWDPRSLEIHVYGRLIARGTPERRIRFGPKLKENKDRSKVEPTWFGIVFQPARKRTSRLIWCSINRAQSGVQVCGRELLIENTMFARCAVGLGTGILRGAKGEVKIIRPEDTSPVLRSCLFVQCRTALFNEGDARPDLERCVILDCETGLGSAWVESWIRPVHGVGARLERCEFIRCAIAVTTSARVSNCIFELNTVGIRSSTAHSDEAITIDRYRIDGLLAHNNTKLLSGDLPPALNVRNEPIKRQGKLPPTNSYDPSALWGTPLKSALALATDSPGIGTATDGGDLGAFGRRRQLAPLGMPKRAVVQGLALDSWLICGPANTKGARDPAWPRRKPRLGMRGLDFIWLGVADAFAQPRRPGGSLTDGPANERYIVATVMVEGKEPVRLGISFDGNASVWCDGRPLLRPMKLTFAKEIFVTTTLKKGVHRFTFRIDPDASRAPFRARLTDKNGNAPIGVYCVSQQIRPGKFKVHSVKANRAPNETFSITVQFSSLPFWVDAMNTKNYSLVSADGKRHALRSHRVQYLPRASRIVFDSVHEPALGTFRLAIRPMRDAWGKRRAPEISNAKLTFK